MKNEQHDEVIDLGAATLETRGSGIHPPADADNVGLRNFMSGIADD